MKVTNQRIVMERGDSVQLEMPNGQILSVGFGGGGQVPGNNPHVIVSVAGEYDIAYEVRRSGKVKTYLLE